MNTIPSPDEFFREADQRAAVEKGDSIVVSPKSAPELDAALLLALNETLRELRIEEENDLVRAPTLRTGRAIKRARLDVYARIGIICHPVIARLVTDKGDKITFKTPAINELQSP